jgi:hypothetical protein
LPLHAAFLIEPVPQKLNTEFGDLGLELGAQFLSLPASTSPTTSMATLSVRRSASLISRAI